MKIFFIRNVPNNIPWSLKVFPVMPVTIFPRKTMKNSCFFLSVCHCGTLYSKSVILCARPSTALWRPAARQLQSDGSLRLLRIRSSALDMFSPWRFSTIPRSFARSFGVRSPADHFKEVHKKLSFVRSTGYNDMLL